MAWNKKIKQHGISLENWKIYQNYRPWRRNFKNKTYQVKNGDISASFKKGRLLKEEMIFNLVSSYNYFEYWIYFCFNKNNSMETELIKFIMKNLLNFLYWLKHRHDLSENPTFRPCGKLGQRFSFIVRFSF